MKSFQSPLRLSGVRQRGISLVEIMVSMAIGMVILGAIGYLFVGSKTTSNVQSDLLRMQESGRNSMSIMGRAIRQAGYKSEVNYNFSRNAIDGSDGGAPAEAGLPPPSDVLVAYHDPFGTSEANCEGEDVTSNSAVVAATGLASQNTNLVAYRFFVAADGLRCSASNPASAADTGVLMAEGVENLQVTYGAYGAAGDELASYSDTPPANPPVVRVSVLVRGSTPGLALGSTSVNFGGATLTFTDGFLRQVYTSTFTVRNNAR